MILTVEEWLGKDNQLGIDIMSNKYIFNNENVEEFIYRVSGGNEELADLICKLIFFFGGRTLANRNTGKKATMMNCYSEGYVEDSMESILEIVNNIALTFKSQGGEGLSLSKIRPKGCGINHGQFKSDGIVPFMELFNQTTASISQGGSRKGALLMSLDAWHKEAPEFVTIKSNEGKIQKANLSLEIDDDFMSDVKKYYDHGEVVTRHIIRDYNGNQVEYDVTPINLYKLMMKQAYDWAEPGCIFTNRFRNYNLMEYCDDYNIVTGNPCVTGDTKILTDKGHYKICDLVGQKVKIWNGYKFSEVVPKLTATNQEIYKIKFSNGSELKCTPYHKFILKDGSRIECSKLVVGDKLIKCEMPIINGSEVLRNAYTQGFFSGDGFVCKDRNAKYISFYGQHKKPLIKYCAIVNKREESEKRITCSIDVDYDKKFVPVNDYTIASKIEWLAGIVDSDGSNNVDGSISITSIEKDFIRDIFYMLETLGVTSVWSKCKDSEIKEFPESMGGRKYHTQNLYRIVISASDVTRLNKLGFNPHRVFNNCIPNRDAKRFIEVVNIEQISEKQNVYCFTEKDNHSGIFNGVITAQCGEQPLAAKSACDLGSINLSELVLDPFTARARFDFEMFGKAIDIAVRALDEIIDENKDNHALPEQREMSLNYRNIGLGTMGMWDMLCKLKLKYGSQESKDFINILFGYMFRRAVIASSSLAKEKGAFPKYDSNVLKSTIIKRHFTDEELHKLEIDKYGLRNCSLLSIAPNGSIGSMLNISTGCEPIFQISYKRKTESLNGKDSYYDVYTKTAKQYMDLFHTDKLPDYFVSAGDIDWKDRIDIQAIMQDHIDTAISSTINLPNSATIDEIEQLYLYAWEQGLKGVTIFRDGCKRAGILTTDKNTKKENDKKNNNTMNHVENTKIKSVPHKKLERGMIIKADDNCIGKKRTLRTGCGTLHCEAFFDPDTGQLLETYFSKGSSGGCNQFMIGLSRMISLCARGGVDIYSIVDQLKSSGTCPSYAVRRAVNKDTSLGSSCPVAIGNALIDMYEDMQNEINCDSEDEEELSYSSLDKSSNVVDDRIQDNDHVQNPCPQCGAELVFEGGCNVCKSCGWSKCD